MRSVGLRPACDGCGVLRLLQNPTTCRRLLSACRDSWWLSRRSFFVEPKRDEGPMRRQRTSLRSLNFATPLTVELEV
jgi:hypothetical protein